MAGLLGQEALEAGQLVAEGQGAVGGPLALGRIPVRSSQARRRQRSQLRSNRSVSTSWGIAAR